MVSHSVATLRSYCDMAVVVHGGDVELYDDLEEGIAVHNQLMDLTQAAQPLSGAA